MAWLDQSPQVLVNTDAELVIEESHFGRASFVVVGLFLFGIVLIPAITTGVSIGSWLAAIVSIVLGGFLVGVPFLTVLAFSKYRRLEVRTGGEILSTTYSPFWRPRLARVEWSEIARVVYERRSHRHPHRLGRLRVILHTTAGTQHQLLRGWYSVELKTILHRRFGDQFEFVDKVLAW